MKPSFEVWLQLDAFKLPNKLSRVGVGGVLDQMKIRLTQPQVELETERLSTGMIFIMIGVLIFFISSHPMVTNMSPET